MSYGMTRYSNPASGVYGSTLASVQSKLDLAKSARDGRQRPQAVIAVMEADKLARGHVEALKPLAQRGDAPALAAHDGLVALWKEQIKPVIDALKLDPMGAAGYYPLGGNVVAPPGAGKYLFVPFQADGTSNALAIASGIAAGTRFDHVVAGQNSTFTMVTPQLGWLNKYRMRGIVARAYRDAGAATDFVGFSGLRILGGPVAFQSEQPYPITHFEVNDPDRMGLRYNGELNGVLQAQLTVRGFASGAAIANTAGNTVVCAWLVVEILDDSIYGKLNSPEMRKSYQDSLRAAAQLGGYEYAAGTPVASTLEEIPMIVETGGTGAGGVNFAGQQGMFQLTNAQPVLDLISDQIPWATNEIVCMKVGTPIKATNTDVALINNFRYGGGTQLNAAEGEYEITGFLGDTGGPLGGGIPSLVGFRAYPSLSETNRVRCTLQARNGLTAASGMAGASITIPYVSVVVNTIKDDVLGKGVGTPFSDPLHFLR